MATPESLIFDDISLTDDTDGDNTSSLGGSERTIGNWTIRLLDENGNVGSPDTEFLDVISDPEESVLVDSTDYGLRVLGTFGTVAAAEFAATDGEKFWLKSFQIDNYGMGEAENDVFSDTVRVVGYADGVEVGHQDFTVTDFVNTTVTLQGKFWQSIDTFRIVQPDGAPDIAFVIDDIVVAGVPVPPTLTGDLEATVAEGGGYTITTADLNFSDPDDDAAGVRFTVSAASNGTVQVNGKAATSFTGAELAAGKVTFVHSGSESTKASFKVSVEDGNEDGSTPVAGTFNLAVTPVNDAPTLTGDLKATVKEGGSYTITTADLNFSDPDDGPSDVRFTVSAASNGTVQVNGKAATSFTGAELAAGKVSFVHSGAESAKASFKVAVEDGDEDGSTPVAGTFNLAVTPVNDAPALTGDLKATVKEGGSYTITTADLNFSDPDDSTAGVRFTVSAASNGKVQVNGKAATSFTGAELASGKVSFVHSGAESTKASFKVAVEDGNEDRSTPVARTFSFAVTPVNDAPELVATQTLRKIAEDASTASARKVATLEISDPDGGNNKLSLAGSDAKLFEIKNGALWLKKGAKLDYETNPSLNVTVRLDDPSIGTKHEDWQTFKVAVTDVMEAKHGTSGNDKLNGSSGKDALYGKGGNDILYGRGGNDILSGGAGNDRLIGGAGNDRLTGGSGDDRLTGGSGVDTLTGGSGRDTFVFTSTKDTGLGNDKRDTVTDFVHARDKLDLSQIDANSTRSGDQDFVWRGTNDFTGKAGELIFRIFDEKGTKNDRTIVYGDTDRDHRADFQIELTGIIDLTKGDFIL
ncbi:Ig-like domain-containing protein [Rhizobium sp. TRM96647]|uniref:cadherin-like domain-containing protein n=1 Tax=unclassified Rhizobium TaxID=2613769 RepID=UPI0021E91FCA|nr:MULTISPECIES: cadherin-like domain-containing protein [unclassified Rhizobium]MCV3734608.1 Ig-like domain-containing protein [Rhizobium sp. TRM96647]MCV3756978.1 Ig-like domain-containing protein [Rhizobium sp. TRM96650]